MIDAQPYCSVCGITEEDARKKDKHLIVHHEIPFHLHPEMELLESNLIVLCESRGLRDCHFLWGHLGLGWDKNNPKVREMAGAMLSEVLKGQSK